MRILEWLPRLAMAGLPHVRNSVGIWQPHSTTRSGPAEVAAGGCRSSGTRSTSRCC